MDVGNKCPVGIINVITSWVAGYDSRRRAPSFLFLFSPFMSKILGDERLWI